ncbi:hypothetical protein COB52_05330 [Candidatus Kaiserbacteria bacterium]|nr:MAG: hypothetical protein COB52_05330 [Candidatus Kaiserbacteria bacterium]
MHENALEYVTLMLDKAEYEESIKNVDTARAIYTDLYENKAPSYIRVILAYCNFECRHANFDKTLQIYE